MNKIKEWRGALASKVDMFMNHDIVVGENPPVNPGAARSKIEYDLEVIGFKYINKLVDNKDSRDAAIEEILKIIGKIPPSTNDLTRRELDKELINQFSNMVLQLQNSWSAVQPERIESDLENIRELTKSIFIALTTLTFEYSREGKPSNDRKQEIARSIYTNLLAQIRDFLANEHPEMLESLPILSAINNESN